MVVKPLILSKKQAFEKKFLSADLLLHTEAFDEKNIDLVKHSVSTKIADSLAVGIPLMAYGPDRISSMKHLLRNDCALAATSADTLKKTLETALFDKDARAATVANALLTAQRYHDNQKNSQRLKTLMLGLTADLPAGSEIKKEGSRHE